MSTSVENRVVEMKFDNQQFERNANVTIETLEKLKESLDFEGNAKTLKQLSDSIGEVDFSSMANAIESISKRFSNMGVIGMTVLSELTSKALDFATNALQAPIQQIMSGGRQRALNIEQAKFQLEGLGVAWEDVSEAINASVRGTAYGLDEAAVVASQLAASQVPLSDMERSLKAVSGVAAMTGDSFANIGRIFTQTAGQGRLMGYQLQQLSMRGLNVAATIADYYTKTKGELYTEAQIRDIISDPNSNISFDDFASAMYEAYWSQAEKANDLYSGALSNLKAALSRIGADYYGPALADLRDVMNATRPVIDKFHEAIRPLNDELVSLTHSAAQFAIGIMDGIMKSDHWVTQIQAFSKGVRNLIKAVENLIKPAKEAFNEIFTDRKTPSWLANWGDAFESFTKNIEKATRNAELFKSIFRVLFSVIKTVLTVLRLVATAVLKVAGAFGRLVGHVATLVASWYQANIGAMSLTDKLRELYNEFINLEIVRSISTIFRNFVEATKSFGSQIQNTFNKISQLESVQKLIANLSQIWASLQSSVHSAWGSINQFFADLAGKKISVPGLEWLVKFVDQVADAINTIIDKFREAPEKVKKFAEAFRQGFSNLFSGDDTGNIEKGVGELSTLQKILLPLSTLGKGLKSVIIGIIDVLAQGYAAFRESGIGTAFVNAVVATLEGFGTLIASTMRSVQPLLKNLKDGSIIFILYNIGALLLTFKNVTKGLGEGVTGFLGALGSTITAYQKEINANAIKKIAEAMLIFAGAMAVMALLPTQGLVNATVSMTVLLFMMNKIINTMTRLEGVEQAGTVLSIAGMMIALGVAISAFAYAMRTFEYMDIGDIVKGFLTIYASLILIRAVIMGFIETTKHMDGVEDKMSSLAKMVLSLSVAIGIMAVSMSMLENVDPLTIISFLGGVSAVLSAVLLLTERMKPDQIKNIKSIGNAFRGLGVAMLLLTGAIAILGLLPVDNLIKGGVVVGALVGLLIALTAVAKGMDKSIGLLGLAFIGVGIAIDLMLAPLIALSLIPLNKIGAGLLAFCVAIGAVAVILKSLSGLDSGSVLKAAASMIIAAAAVQLIAGAVVMLGLLAVPALVGIIALAATFMVLGVAGLVLKGLSSTLLEVGASLVVMVLPVLMVAAAVFLFAESVKIVVDSIGNLGDSLKRFVSGALEAAQMFIENVDTFKEGVGLAIDSILQLLVDKGPELLQAGVLFIGLLAQAIAGAAGEIAAAVMVLITTVLIKIGEGADMVARALVIAVINIINAVSMAIMENRQILVLAVENLLLALSTIILTELSELIGGINEILGLDILDTAQAKLEGFADSIAAKMEENTEIIKSGTADATAAVTEGLNQAAPQAQAAGGGLRDSILSGLDLPGITDSLSAGGEFDIGTALSGNFDASAETVGASAANLNTAITDNIDLSGAIEKISSGGEWDIATALTGNFDNATATVPESAAALGDATAQALTTYDDSFTTAGESSGAKYAEGISNAAKNAGTTVSTSAATSINNNASKFKTAGSNSGAKYASGITSKSSSSRTAGRTIATSGSSGANSQYHSFYSAGAYLGTGLDNGIRSKGSTLYTSGVWLAGRAKAGVQAGLQEKSPSKWGIQAGKYLDEGIEIGIRDRGDEVESEARVMASGVILGLAETLRKADDMFSSYAFTPTITPVVEIDNALRSAKALTDIFNNGTYATTMSAKVSGEMDANAVVLEYIDKLDQANSSRNQAIVSTIEGVRKDITVLGERIENLEMVMDSGEVVGALTPKMDKSLGKRIARKNRGI